VIRARSLRATVAALVGVLALATCGSEQDGQLAGAVLDPLPVVAGITLPDATDGLRPFELRAEPGGLLIVYFGYTNCPDFCPTTMSDVKLARSRLDAPERISVAMVTVDPRRDFVEKPELCEGIVLACYVRSFVDDAHALGTDDPTALQRAAAPFGAAYNVIASGDEVVVEHTTYLYAVDDQGRIVVSWQFGIPIDDLVSDMQTLLDRADAA
jgi:protein SCO1